MILDKLLRKAEKFSAQEDVIEEDVHPEMIDEGQEDVSHFMDKMVFKINKFAKNKDFIMNI